MPDLHSLLRRFKEEWKQDVQISVCQLLDTVTATNGDDPRRYHLRSQRHMRNDPRPKNRHVHHRPQIPPCRRPAQHKLTRHRVVIRHRQRGHTRRPARSVGARHWGEQAHPVHGPVEDAVAECWRLRGGATPFVPGLVVHEFVLAGGEAAVGGELSAGDLLVGWEEVFRHRRLLPALEIAKTLQKTPLIKQSSILLDPAGFQQVDAILSRRRPSSEAEVEVAEPHGVVADVSKQKRPRRCREPETVTP
mmetsp:Transcript_21346/g.54529  ORF Transcript_21346/g.54529 Transcript_21346/m.54529 type:complete len:248 (-) Transcript_21346:599-1342(-)